MALRPLYGWGLGARPPALREGKTLAPPYGRRMGSAAPGFDFSRPGRMRRAADEVPRELRPWPDLDLRALSRFAKRQGMSLALFWRSFLKWERGQRALARSGGRIGQIDLSRRGKFFLRYRA